MKQPITLGVGDDIPQIEQSSVLYALASEYQRMATTADTVANTRALDDLAKGFTALAEQREANERATKPEPGWSYRLSSHHGLTKAAETVLERSIVPETIRCLAYRLMPLGLVPYGLVPMERASPSSNPPRVAQRVLVVDDTADVLVAVGAFLVGGGFVVLSASDGDTALQLIARDPQISVLITDYAMPGLSGVELIKQAVQMRPTLKALLITGYPNADGLTELPSHIQVLTKPFRRAALIAQVTTLVTEAPMALPEPAMGVV